jgi:hypothetical protein
MNEMAPVVVFGYNRPDHLRKTLEHLAQADGASDSHLWIFCDGPKPGADASCIEAVRVQACRDVWNEYFASVRIETSELNKGLARSIIDGVSAVLKTASRVIVIEDDLLVAQDFLLFMNDCLAFYKDDEKVGSITGFSPLAEPPSDYTKDIMALPRNCSHGWATWADRWHDVDWNVVDAVRLWREPALRRRFNAVGNDRVDRLHRQLAGTIDSWSIRFGLWQTLNGRHTIYPLHNRVHNIGFDGTGIHTRQGQDVNARALTTASSYRLEPVAEDQNMLRRVARIYGGPWYKRMLREVRMWLRAKNV